MESVVDEISQEEAVRLGAQDFVAYGTIFFPKTFRQESPEMHREIGRQLYAQHRKTAIIVFRDGAKTTLTRVFVSQRIAYCISRTIMFVSVSQEHSIHSLRWLKRQIERNTKWAQTFGLRPGGKWTDEWIEVYSEIEDVTMNILAVGITGQIRGFNLDDFRPDLIVCDDILTEENTKTEQQRKKIEDLFHGAIVNSLQAETEAPHAKVVLLQTPFHDKDVAMQCAGDPAWHPLVLGIFDENGQSRWPAKFPTAAVLAEKEEALRMGRKRLWMREKECKIVKSEDVTLNTDLLQYWTEIPPRLLKFISIDPASSDKKKADNNVVLCAGCRGPDVFVLAYRASKGTMPDQCATTFFDMATRFPPIVRAGVEAVAYQRTLKWYIEQEMRQRSLWVPTELIEDRRHKADRILQHIPGLLRYGHLHVHASMNELINEMDEYDPTVEEQTDDILDALAMAIKLMGPLLQSSYIIEGEARVIDEESYIALECNGGCP